MNDLDKMNLIAIVQQLPKDDIDFIETYISIMEEKITKLKKENDLLKADIEASQEIISDYKKEEEKYKLIIKALKKHFTDLEYYEDNEFLRQLLSVTDNDMIWLKRMAGDDKECQQEYIKEMGKN